MNENEMKKRLNDFGVQEVKILESDQATNRIRLYFLAGTCKVQKQSPIPGYENKKRPDDLDTRGWKVKGEPKAKGLSALQIGYWIGLSQGQTQVEIQFFLDRNDTDPYTTQVIIPPWLNASPPEETDRPMIPPPSAETKSNHSRAASQAATGQAGQKGNGFQAATPSNSQDLYKQKQAATLPPQTTTYKSPELGDKNQSTKKTWPGQSQGGDAGRSNITNNDWEKKAFGDDRLANIINELNVLRLKVQTLESGPQGREIVALNKEMQFHRDEIESNTIRIKELSSNFKDLQDVVQSIQEAQQQIQALFTHPNSKFSAEDHRNLETEKRLAMLCNAIDRDRALKLAKAKVSQEAEDRLRAIYDQVEASLQRLLQPTYGDREIAFLKEVTASLFNGLNSIVDKLPESMAPQADQWRSKAADRIGELWESEYGKALDAFSSQEDWDMPDPYGKYLKTVDAEVKMLWKEYLAAMEDCQHSMISNDLQLQEALDDFAEKQVLMFIRNTPGELGKWYESMPPEKRKSAEDIRQVMDEIADIAGIEEIPMQAGKTRFDSTLHVAGDFLAYSNMPPDVITEILSQGFRLKHSGKVIKQALVSVNRG